MLTACGSFHSPYAIALRICQRNSLNVLTECGHIEVHILSGALARIVEAEKQAAEILNEANIRAQKIKGEAEENVQKAFTEAYEEAIATAEKEAAHLRKTARENAEREVESALGEVEQQIRDMQSKARKNLDEAANAVLAEILLSE